jgi:DNA polymerase sigma
VPPTTSSSASGSAVGVTTEGKASNEVLK